MEVRGRDLTEARRGHCAPLRIVVMGVSGAGKSTVGEALARRLGVRFIEGDALHDPGSLAKMARGEPLHDEDRRPWLERVAEALHAAPEGAVVACSALRRRYRDLLRARGPDKLLFVHLVGPPDLIRARLAARPGHFMPPGLLSSQLETLEPTAEEADVLEVSVTLTVEESVAQSVDRLIADPWHLLSRGHVR